MARFSRLRRSARMLLLAAGFGGLTASPVWSCIGAQESPQPSIVTTSKAVAVDAYITGFKTMVAVSATQEYGSRPTLANGKTMAQIILAQHEKEGKNFLGLDFSWTDNSPAEIVSAQLGISCYQTAREIDLELLSLKFHAMEQLEAAALAHCREFAVNTHLFGSVVTTLTQVPQPTDVELPGFSFETVTVPAGGTVLIGANKFPQQTSARSFIASIDAAEAVGMEASRQLMISAWSKPLVLHHVGSDGLQRIGIDFELNRALGNGPMYLPRIIISEEEENLLGVAVNDAPPAPQTVAAALLANGAKATRKLHCVQIAPADYIQVTAYRAVTSSYEALLEMPFSMDKLFTLQIEIAPLQEPGLPGINGCFGPAPAEQPTLRMSSLTQERMLRHFAKTVDDSTANRGELSKEVHGFQCVASDDITDDQGYHFPKITSWKQLQTKCFDAAPAENPAAEIVNETGIEPQPEAFVQQLPPSSDAPLANPPAVAAVSPTMSPLEYAEVFLTQDERENLPEGTEMLLSEHNAVTGRIVGFGGNEEDTVIRIFKRSGSSTAAQRRDDQVLQTAHDEEAKAWNNPMLRALGGPISVTPCESETCKGFTIQFAPCQKPAATAEVEAFDGPAQIMLQDCPGKCGNGFAWPAQPVACEESLDELAQRLEREFLRRAVSGEIQLPETCPGNGAPVCGTPAAAKANCTDVCPPGLDAPRGTPGFALPDPVCAVKIPRPGDQAKACTSADCAKTCGGECCCAKKDRVPVPAVTINPFVQGPGAGTVLPRDCDFYFRSPMEVPPSCGPVPAGSVYPTAPACCDSQACTCTPACAATQQTPPVCGVPAPQLAMVPPTPAGAYPSAARGPQLVPAPAPMMLTARPAASAELLETHRDISRALDQLAERCESQAMYEKADELRDLAREYRMGARVIHGHLNAMMPAPGPLPGAHPVAWFPPAPMMTAPMMPYPMPAPPTYAPEPMPTFGPPASPVAPATYPQQLPIAQPMVAPRY